MDDQFTLGINSAMELLDSNMNRSLRKINSSNNINFRMFSPLAENNFLDHHQTHDRSLPFMPLSNGTNDNPSFDLSVDHQGSSFYDPTTYLNTTRDDTFKRNISGDKSFGNSNPDIVSSGDAGEKKANKNYGSSIKRRKKNNEAQVEKPREVVHVRARRGEATDSHSLAERSRREKINGKLQCLQELVPGCYKTMGMSVMLDVTIHYIRSLQNQIEFLSMKLSAASMFYDFNSPEMDAFDTMKGANGYETQVMDRMGGEGYSDLLQFQSICPF